MVAPVLIMMNNKKSDEIVITALSDKDSVRSRPGMYVGAVNNPDVIFREVIDGSFDESFAWPGCNRILISTDFNGYYFCADNGRGIPIKLSDSPGYEHLTQVVLAFSKLHAGSHFQTTDTIKIGMHGCGESCAVFTSSEFIVLSRITAENYNKSIPDVQKLWESRSRKKDLYYVAIFREGDLVYESAGTKKEIEKMIFGGGSYMELPSDMSTLCLFRPDPKIYDSVVCSVPTQNIQNFLLIQEKFYKRKVYVNVNGEEFVSSGFKPYAFEFTRTMIPRDNSMNPSIAVYVTFEVDPALGNKLESGSVNGLVVNQGVHVNWIETLFSEALRQEFKIKHKYILNGLRFHVVFIANEVLFDSQTKTRLRGVSKVKIDDMSECIKDFIKIFRKYSDYWGLHVDKLNALASSMKSISAMDKAEDLKNVGGNFQYKIKNELRGRLIDCTAGSSERWMTECFISEGLSAGTAIINARPNSKYYASYLLRGRVMNCSGLNEEQMLDNAELAGLYKAIGVGLDINSVISEAKDDAEAYGILKRTARYSKLIISTDADADGAIISSTLLYDLYRYSSFLFKYGMIYILESPIFSQGGKYYYPSDPMVNYIPVGLDLSKPHKRYKGLGSLNGEEIPDVFFNPATRRIYQVTLDGVDNAVSLVDDIKARKELLISKGILTNPYNV